MMDFKLEIWAILLGFKPLCLDLGHLAYIWAILLGFGLFGRIWVSIGPKGDEALRMGWGYVQMDGWTDRFPLCFWPPPKNVIESLRGLSVSPSLEFENASGSMTQLVA